MSKEIAQTILSQLGGNKFVAMTGASSFASGNFDSALANGPGLSFKLPRGSKSGINGVIITLNGFDLYDLVFLKQKRAPSFEVVPVNNYANVGAEEMAEIFTNETGLYTKL